MAEDAKGDLQFDRAEYEGNRPVKPRCSSCGQEIWSVYYAANDRLLCERCKADLELQGSQGSRIGRFARASLYGAGAGAVGAGIWYAVRATTGYELGLIAIVVGLMVGGAVHKGSNGRGGWRYQALAMFLTYASIVSTYVPEVVGGLKQVAEKSPQASAPPAPSEGASPAPTAQPSTPVRAASARDPSQGAEPMGAGRALLAVGVFLLVVAVIAFAAPFLGGFENIMGIVIMGIALYEAWKINRRQPLVITGPHRVGAVGEPAGSAGGSGDAPVEPGHG
jgi:hypothetical protein